MNITSKTFEEFIAEKENLENLDMCHKVVSIMTVDWQSLMCDAINIRINYLEGLNRFDSGETKLCPENVYYKKYREVTIRNLVKLRENICGLEFETMDGIQKPEVLRI